MVNKAHRVIHLEMAIILKEKGFNYVLPNQKLYGQSLLYKVKACIWFFRKGQKRQ